ncbi:MAG: EAL domain-containing protein [bacterium]|nr:EAL domain-containing protein [bacterium]
MTPLSTEDDQRSWTIMMVDDEPTTVDVIEMFLQGEGYEHFVSVMDSRLALEAIAREHPDVLLLDLMMPNVGGLQILSALREDEALQRIPVIILTSSSEPEVKLQALELGANDFLAKPVDRSELALRVRNTLAAKAYQDRVTYYDALTGLPNRRLFQEGLEPALRRARRDGSNLALLHLGLDRFRQINDTLGQGAGDAILKGVAERMEKSVAFSLEDAVASDPYRATCFRIGGDEFMLLLTGPGAVEAAPRIGRQLLSLMAEPFTLKGQDLFTSCSIGIAIHPNDANDADALLANAGVAMSHAKQRGGHRFEYYDESLNAQSLERLGLESDLRRALERGEISLHYQPKVGIESGRIAGAEALMRWTHPEHGFVPPDRFIAIAEEIGVINSLGEWALREAAGQSRAWADAGFPGIRIAVNVSSRQFRPGTLVETIQAALESSGLDGNSLAIELTESVIMEKPHETADMLWKIKEMGVRISIDDFGTGYSSLSYLKRFPIDELKIDRSFVQGVPEDADDAAIVTAIVAMARSLGQKVVAEGVETEGQLEFLRWLGCDEYQGYLCSKPLPPESWSELLKLCGPS